jgi:tetratricopeptide (TPR) repeat protein
MQWMQQSLRAGFAALTEGRLREASDCCRKVLNANPKLVEGHFLVGLVALEMQDRKTAFSAFTTVTKIDKTHTAAWAQLAKLFMSEGQVNRADAALKEAGAHKSKDPVVYDLLGSVYSMMGEHGIAQLWFLKANQVNSKHPSFMLNLANNYIYHGKTETADDLFKKIIALQPNSPQAHWSLAGATKAEDHSHIEEMTELLGQENLHPRAIPFYHYAIAKELEDLQEWDKAFAAIDKGAKARRQTVEFDEASEIAMFDFLHKHYTSEWLDGRAEGYNSDAPIFVLGQPRTGTTLVERIISSHSQVHAAGELQQFGLAIRRLSNHQDPKRFSAKLFEAALELDHAQVGEMYLQTTKRMQGGKARFVDKLPQNYLHIPLILAALPKAKIVHLTRNPMDACFASFKQLFADAYLHSYDQKEMARHHVRYRLLMKTWRERFPGRFFDISYEDTARNLETNARALIEYLDLPWEDACLNFHEQDSAVSTASAVQVRQPVHTRSIDRWKEYEQHLQTMMETLRQEGVSTD